MPCQIRKQKSENKRSGHETRIFHGAPFACLTVGREYKPLRFETTPPSLKLRRTGRFYMGNSRFPSPFPGSIPHVEDMKKLPTEVSSFFLPPCGMQIVASLLQTPRFE